MVAVVSVSYMLFSTYRGAHICIDCVFYLLAIVYESILTKRRQSAWICHARCEAARLRLMYGRLHEKVECCFVHAQKRLFHTRETTLNHPPSDSWIFIIRAVRGACIRFQRNITAIRLLINSIPFSFVQLTVHLLYGKYKLDLLFVRAKTYQQSTARVLVIQRSANRRSNKCRYPRFFLAHCECV